MLYELAVMPTSCCSWGDILLVGHFTPFDINTRHKLYTLKYSFSCLLLFISLVTSSQTHSFSGGTAIITVLTKDSVIVAADSRLSNMTNRSLADTIYKIGVRGNICYAIAGEFVFIKDTVAKHKLYDAYEIIDSLLVIYNDIDTAITKFTNTSLLLLNDALGNSPAYFTYGWAKLLQNRVMEIQLTTFENGLIKYRYNQIGFQTKPKLTSLLLKNDKDSVEYGWPLVNVPITDSNNTYPQIRFMGISDHLETEEKIVKVRWNNIIQNLKAMVKKEAMYHDTLVGEPIRVLVIYPNNKFRWVD